MDPNLEWLLTSEGQSFMFQSKWNFGQKTSLMVGPQHPNFANDPLATIANYYRDEQLQKALSILLLPGQSTGHVQEALIKIQNVNDSNSKVPRDKLMLDQDPIAKWWSSVLSTSANWMLNHSAEASQFYQIMESVPFFEEEEKIAVGKAIVSTFNAAKSVQEKGLHLNYTQIFNKASNDLDIAAKCVKYSTEGELSLTDQELVLKNCLLLACDWQLQTRTSYWQATNGGQVSSNYLHAFEKDLNSLRRITESLFWTRPRVYLHEATLRMMAGAAPNKTRQLLDKSLIQKSPSRGLFCGGKDDRMVLTGEREHAIALLMACRHLPSQMLCSPGERAGMLAEAAKTLRKIGDQKSLDDCNNLMKTLGISLPF